MAVHLEELMSDCNLYGLEKVRAYHAVWLNQIKQEQLSWDDTEEKLRFCWALVWHSATSTSMAALISIYAGGKKYSKLTGAYNAPASHVPRPVNPSMRGCVLQEQPAQISTTSVHTAWQPSTMPYPPHRGTAIERGLPGQNTLKRGRI